MGSGTSGLHAGPGSAGGEAAMAARGESREEESVVQEALAARYRRPLVQWFRKRGLDHEAAEDCAQESFARLYGSSTANVQNPDAYLFRVASSVLADRRRRARVRQEDRHLPIDDFDAPSEEPTPARVFEDREALTRLSAALAELPARTREMFLLNRLDRASYSEIAARFGISVSAVEKHMMKVIAHLHARFGQNG